MSHREPIYATVNDWIAREALPFSVDVLETVQSVIDKVLASSGSLVELLGLGEPFHSGEEILIFRNQLFEHLVTEHGFSAIAFESSFPKSWKVNEYVAGQSSLTYEQIQDTGFSPGFGRLDANRELVEWMRQYNADPAHDVKLQFYGFDSPTEMTGTDSPRQLLSVMLDYLAEFDSISGQEHRRRIDPLLGEDAAWENPAAMLDPAQAIGLTPAASALRLETEELISELRVRSPEFVAKSGESRYQKVLHCGLLTRQLLNYHAMLARNVSQRQSMLLNIRDTMMADNLAYIVAEERSRGKVLVFAHNAHLRRGKMQWQWGADLLTWWPAGAHLNELFGARYVTIGTGLGIADEIGIAQPEVGSLEERLMSLQGTVVCIPTYRGYGFPAPESAALPTRSGNQMYFPLKPEDLTEFDYLAVFDSIRYARGAPSLTQ